MQAPGDRVAAATELAAGVQHGEHDLDGGATVLGPGDRLHRDAAPVVEHAHRTVGVHRDRDLVGEARHGLVDRVVDDLGDEVV